MEWVRRWEPARLPDADALIATAWQSARAVAAAPARCGRRFYLIQHYESLYHGEPARVDATYGLPLERIVISSWLQEIMRERFRAPATVIVTPVDLDLFHPVAGERDDGQVRVLMLHHEYPWKGVADGLEAIGQVRARHPSLRLVGFGVKAPRGPVALRRVSREPASGTARLALQPLPDLPLSVVGRGARDAGHGGHGVRRRPGDV